MNSTDRLSDEIIQAAFARRAHRATASGLRDQIVGQVFTTRQRSRVALRLAGVMAARPSRRAVFGTLVFVALLSLGIAALIAQKPHTPFRTGLFAFVRDGDVYLAKPDGKDARVVLHEDGIAMRSVAWSPDGRHLAVDGDSGTIVIDAVTGAPTFIGGRSPAWSPDARQLAVLGDGDQGTQLRILDLGTGTATTREFNVYGGLSWSPDGRWIVAPSWEDRRNAEILRMDVLTGAVIDVGLPSDAGRQSQLAWSPDSQRLAFARRTSNGFGCGGVMCESDVFISAPGGSGVVALNDHETTSADQPTWSPDGSWIAFRQAARRTSSSVGDQPVDEDANVGLAIVSPDDPTLFRTLDAHGVQAFAWSPEGDRIRYVRTEGLGQPSTVWEVPVDSGDGVTRPLGTSIDRPRYSEFGTSLGAAWQPIARRAHIPTLPAAASLMPAATAAIATPGVAPPVDPSDRWPTLAVESEDGCRPGLVATHDGSYSEVDDLCDPVADGVQYGWSPDGSLHASSTGDHLSVIGRDGQPDTALSEMLGVGGFGWSPGGSWLSLSGSGDRIVRRDGSGLRDLPGSPTWSPDESRLSIIQADGTLLVGAGDGTGLEPVGSFGGWVVFSHDGSRFAFIRDGDVWTAAADGTDVRNVTAFPVGGAQTLAWAPDGRSLAVGTPHAVWMVSPDSGNRRGLVLDAGRSVGALVWAPDGSRLAIEAYSDGSSSQQNQIYLMNAVGSAAIQVDGTIGPSWSPDGRYLAVTSVHPSPGGGYENGDLELMNADGSGRRDLPVHTNGIAPIWVIPGR